MMSVQLFWTLSDLLIKSGFYADLNWAEGVEPCNSALEFSREHCFVVCNSGMKAGIARQIFERVWLELETEGHVSASTFRHAKKVEAINEVYRNRDAYFESYRAAADPIAFLETLPHIGPIVKFHLAKNLGIDCAKPDRHLQRIAAHYGTDTFALCRHLSDRVHFKLNTVDYVLWRAGQLGIIRTADLEKDGEMRIHWDGGTQTEAEIEALKIYSEWKDDGSLAGWTGGSMATEKSIDGVSINSDT